MMTIKITAVLLLFISTQSLVLEGAGALGAALTYFEAAERGYAPWFDSYGVHTPGHPRCRPLDVYKHHAVAGADGYEAAPLTDAQHLGSGTIWTNDPWDLIIKLYFPQHNGQEQEIRIPWTSLQVLQKQARNKPRFPGAIGSFQIVDVSKSIFGKHTKVADMIGGCFTRGSRHNVYYTIETDVPETVHMHLHCVANYFRGGALAVPHYVSASARHLLRALPDLAGRARSVCGRVGQSIGDILRGPQPSPEHIAHYHSVRGDIVRDIVEAQSSDGEWYRAQIQKLYSNGDYLVKDLSYADEARAPCYRKESSKIRPIRYHPRPDRSPCSCEACLHHDSNICPSVRTSTEERFFVHDE